MIFSLIVQFVSVVNRYKKRLASYIALAVCMFVPFTTQAVDYVYQQANDSSEIVWSNTTWISNGYTVNASSSLASSEITFVMQLRCDNPGSCINWGASNKELFIQIPNSSGTNNWSWYPIPDQVEADIELGGVYTLYYTFSVGSQTIAPGDPIQVFLGFNSSSDLKVLSNGVGVPYLEIYNGPYVPPVPDDVSTRIIDFDPKGTTASTTIDIDIPIYFNDTQWDGAYITHVEVQLENYTNGITYPPLYLPITASGFSTLSTTTTRLPGHYSATVSFWGDDTGLSGDYRTGTKLFWFDIISSGLSSQIPQGYATSTAFSTFCSDENSNILVKGMCFVANFFFDIIKFIVYPDQSSLVTTSNQYFSLLRSVPVLSTYYQVKDSIDQATAYIASSSASTTLPTITLHIVNPRATSTELFESDLFSAELIDNPLLSDFYSFCKGVITTLLWVSFFYLVYRTVLSLF